MLGNPAGRHLPPNPAKKPEELCPECKGVGYVGPILGICPCPLGCLEKLREERGPLPRDERGSLK